MSTRTPRPDPEEHETEVEMQSDCERIAPTLHRYVEGELDPIRGQMVERHIATCSTCLCEKEQLDLERLWLVETAFEGPVLSTRLVEKVMEPVRREAAARSRSRLWRGLRYGAAAACLFAALIVSDSSGPWMAPTELSDGRSNDDGAQVSTALLEWSPANSPASSPTSSPEEGSSSENGPDPVLVSDVEGHLSGAERRRLEGSRPGIVHLAFDDGPIERGGFQVGETDSTVVDFGPPNVFYLPQEASREDRSGNHEGPSCGVFVPAGELTRGPRRDGRRPRIFRVKLISLQARASFPFKFRDTVGIALQLRSGEERDGGHGTVRPRAASIEIEPCFPDPNSDGKTDSRDVAYGLQVLYGAQSPDLFDTEAAALDPECEGSCLRA